jgi:hypothetical protein
METHWVALALPLVVLLLVGLDLIVPRVPDFRPDEVLLRSELAQLKVDGSGAPGLGRFFITTRRFYWKPAIVSFAGPSSQVLPLASIERIRVGQRSPIIVPLIIQALGHELELYPALGPIGILQGTTDKHVELRRLMESSTESQNGSAQIGQQTKLKGLLGAGLFTLLLVTAAMISWRLDLTAFAAVFLGIGLVTLLWYLLSQRSQKRIAPGDKHGR